MTVQPIDYDKIAAEYARHRQVHPQVLRNLLETSGIDGMSKVLEVGCGIGNYILALESLRGCECWAIDPSEQMLSRARERSGQTIFQLGRAEKLTPLKKVFSAGKMGCMLCVRYAHTQHTVPCFSVTALFSGQSKLDFEADSFDLIFSVDVIHHVNDRAACFDEAYRVLRPGGRMCTVTDSEWIIRHRQPLSVYFPESVPVELNRYPRIAQLGEFMEHTGFRDIIEVIVEFSYQLTNIQAYRDKAFSSLHLISESAFEKGIARMEEDLGRGAIPCVSRYSLLWGTKSRGKETEIIDSPIAASFCR